MKSKVIITNEELQELVLLTNGFSGAEIVACCTETAITVVNKIIEQNNINNEVYITKNDLIETIKSIKPQITEEMLEFYNNFELNNIV